MKTKSLFVIALFILNGCAMSVVSFSEKEAFVDVFDDMPGTQDQLYLKANRWMVQTFTDAESVIQHSDKEEGAIIGKYLMYGGLSAGLYGATNDTRVFAVIDIRVKDNRARLEIRPQGSWSYDASGMSIYNYSKEDAIKDIERLAQSLYDALLKDDIEF